LISKFDKFSIGGPDKPPSSILFALVKLSFLEMLVLVKIKPSTLLSRKILHKLSISSSFISGDTLNKIGTFEDLSERLM
tara:strand:+ start:3939 stop:4175 length:237 start_codon:yes stop_codon:yes gene_type:complete